MNTKFRSQWVVICTLLFFSVSVNAADLLPSWNEGAAKKAITQYVMAVTTPGSESFVAEPERIAVFDNDGTLWGETPVYFQAFFIFDRIKQLAPAHPEWSTKEPYASVLKGDIQGALKGGEKGLLDMMGATHAGMTSEEFTQLVADWIATAKHPKTGKKFTEMVYQPMLELMAFLRSNGFKTFIVSGGGVEFMRAWAEPVYGIPPEQIIGSRIKTQFELRDGKPVIVRLPELEFLDDKTEKPIGIHQNIGRRPLMAFGNSDGDLQMLQWTMGGNGKRFAALVHHTDAVRESAYDRQSPVGRLDKAFDEAVANNWTIIDMKSDWKTVYPSTK